MLENCFVVRHLLKGGRLSGYNADGTKALCELVFYPDVTEEGVIRTVAS